MVLWHPLLGTDEAQHRGLLRRFTPHGALPPEMRANLTSLRAVAIPIPRVFQHPARGAGTRLAPAHTTSVDRDFGPNSGHRVCNYPLESHPRRNGQWQPPLSPPAGGE